ncbi:hypothetical protein G4V62_06830 [Bacillaceae bacterium SIJ1]|uniref:hypothetical protein n=1 Tax=Litoribacterium kuwaitense TaxID=1398745 RepID=UPI0013E9A7FF|nr:hypothetical protein [Litoribacterium kuwaitense]NGP44680.1 hypothetical protein [Litoribacterium kuwaitense]
MKKQFLTKALIGAMAVGAMGAVGANETFAQENTTSKVVAAAPAENAKAHSLFFDFDTFNHELVQGEGDDVIMLMDKKENRNVFFSWNHEKNTDVDAAAKEEKQSKEDYEGFSAEIVESDLNVTSTKVVDTYNEDGSSTAVYFIDDNAGGVYRVFVNTMALEAFTSDEYVNDVLESMEVVPKAENENLKNVKTIQILGG